MNHHPSRSLTLATPARGAVVRRSLVVILLAAGLLLGTVRRPALLAAAPPTGPQQTYLKASNTEAGDHFGYRVAVSGKTAIVGAPYEDSAIPGVGGNQANNTAPDAGAAYVLTWNGSTWIQEAYLKASNPDAGDNFGVSVAISGDTVVVGAYDEDSAAPGVGGNQANNAAPDAGAAYVFTRSVAQGVPTWTQEAYLKASNPDAGDNFGVSVAISGATVVVGASDESSAANGVGGNQANNAAPDAGAAYVFTRSGATWTQQAYLKAAVSETDDEFGTTVAVDGDTIVVGAEWEDSAATNVNGNQADNSAPNAGAVYVFTRSGAPWTQQAYLKASNPDAGDNFGASIAISGDTVVVGAPDESSATRSNLLDNSAPDSGAAYVFMRSGATWSPQSYLKASNTEASDEFGYSVAISGDTVVVGAQDEDSAASGVDGIQHDNSAEGAGAAYVFTRSGRSGPTQGVPLWSQQAYLKASNTGEDDGFGWCVAISGTTVVVGAYDEDSATLGVGGNPVDNSASNSGAVYSFTTYENQPWP